MKILMLINGLYPEAVAGVEKIGAELAARLAPNHDVIVYTSFQKNLPRREIRNGFQVKRIKSSSDTLFNFPPGLRTFHFLRELNRENPKPDIILSMGLGYGTICYLARKFSGIPFLIYVLGSDWYVARDANVAGKTLRLGLRTCNRLITQTSIVKNDVLEHYPGMKEKIEVIPNGITIPEERSQGKKVVYLGRLHEIKGIAYLIEAVKGIKNCPGVIIAGTGPEENRLKAMGSGLNIEFKGSVSMVDDVFKQGRIFVLPSLSEGLPQAMLEAMSFGLPVVATAVGGVPDIIDHGKNGFLVQPRNAGEIQTYIKTLLDDDKLHRQMSDNCLETIKAYSWENVLSKIETVMNQVVEVES